MAVANVSLFLLNLAEAAGIVRCALAKSAVDPFPSAAAPPQRVTSERRRVHHHLLDVCLRTTQGPLSNTLHLQRNRAGKPYLKSGPYFSLSRSGDFGAVALCHEASIGVDIETLRPVDLSREWVIELQRLAAALDVKFREARGPLAVFEAWVWIEAALKCRGLTLGAAIATAEQGQFGHRDILSRIRPSDLRVTGFELPGTLAGAVASDSMDLRIARTDLLNESALRSFLPGNHSHVEAVLPPHVA